MTDFRPSAFLRKVLIADAATSAAAGLMMFAGAGMLDALLGLPASFLRIAGVSLIPFAADPRLLSRPANTPARAAIWAIIACNAVWVVGSFETVVHRLALADPARHAVRRRAGADRRPAGRAGICRLAPVGRVITGDAARRHRSRRRLARRLWSACNKSQ